VRTMRGLIVAATMLTLLGAVPVQVPPPVPVVLPLDFPDGVWHGTSLYGGAINRPGVWAAANGDVVFDITVLDGKVTDGTMTIELPGTSESATGTANITLTGTLKMSGTAAIVEFSGPVTMKGTATSGGFSVPIDFTGISDGALSPTWVTCNVVSGDLATQARDMQEAAGFTSSVAGPFVAVRSGGEELAQEYAALVAAIADLLVVKPTPEQVLELAQQAEALVKKRAALGACGSLPPDYVPGVPEFVIGDLFQELLQKALSDPDAYTAQELLSLLGSGIRVRAVGNSVPGEGPYQDFAKSLLVQFENALEAKLDAAAAAGDWETVQDIWTAAQQLGLAALADKAKDLWATDK
jgi:hypothetical protein